VLDESNMYSETTYKPENGRYSSSYYTSNANEEVKSQSCDPSRSKKDHSSPEKSVGRISSAFDLFLSEKHKQGVSDVFGDAERLTFSSNKTHQNYLKPEPSAFDAKCPTSSTKKSSKFMSGMKTRDITNSVNSFPQSSEKQNFKRCRLKTQPLNFGVDGIPTFRE